MQPRIENPAMTAPGVLPALQKFAAAVKHAGLPATTLSLVELRASQINDCSVCADMHSRELVALVLVIAAINQFIDAGRVAPQAA